MIHTVELSSCVIISIPMLKMLAFIFINSKKHVFIIYFTFRYHTEAENTAQFNEVLLAPNAFVAEN